MKRLSIILVMSFAALLSACSGHNHSTECTDDHDHAHQGDSAHKTEVAADVDDHGDHSNEIIFTKKQADAVGLELLTVEPASFKAVIPVSGRIEASQGDEATVVATSSGIVKFINPSINDGMAVSSGEALCTISSQNLADGDPVRKAKIAYETAEKEYRRGETLAKDQIISAKDFEQITMRYETAKVAYEALASSVVGGNVRLSAPIRGYVKNISVRNGEYVLLGQPILTISENRRVQLRADVSQRYFNQVKSVAGANFKPAYTDRIYKLSDMNGRMVSFGKSSSQGAYIPVIFEFDNVADVVQGSMAEVYLLTSPREGVIAVPITALVEEQGLYFVYVQLDDEGYAKREVTLGDNNGEQVEIRSGLAAGDKVVTKGAYQVKLASMSSAIPEGHGHSH